MLKAMWPPVHSGALFVIASEQQLLDIVNAAKADNFHEQGNNYY